MKNMIACGTEKSLADQLNKCEFRFFYDFKKKPIHLEQPFKNGLSLVMIPCFWTQRDSWLHITAPKKGFTIR